MQRLVILLKIPNHFIIIGPVRMTTTKKSDVQFHFLITQFYENFFTVFNAHCPSIRGQSNYIIVRVEVAQLLNVVSRIELEPEHVSILSLHLHVFDRQFNHLFLTSLGDFFHVFKFLLSSFIWAVELQAAYHNVDIYSPL